MDNYVWGIDYANGLTTTIVSYIDKEGVFWILHEQQTRDWANIKVSLSAEEMEAERERKRSER